MIFKMSNQKTKLKEETKEKEKKMGGIEEYTHTHTHIITEKYKNKEYLSINQQHNIK